MRTMSTDAIRRRAAELGANFIGPEEWKKISNAAQTSTRRPTPVMEPVGPEVTRQASCGAGFSLLGLASGLPESGGVGGSRGRSSDVVALGTAVGPGVEAVGLRTFALR